MSLAGNLACYAYTPAMTSAAPGERVRVQLTPAGVSDLTRYLGPRVAVAEGTLSSIRADGTVIVGVDWVQMMDGNRQAWNGEEAIAFPALDVAAIERRVLDSRRTAIGAAVLVAAVVALAVAALGTGSAGGGTGVGSGGPPP